ncbi:HAD hydrolase-like protein [Candidatus Saccharibacteria bacterium]|nr:HAD hydrolase-like protein [Candidatus Saccharibacteria bacterium]
MANVIFDFDGTLADTFPLVVDVSYKLAPGTRRLPSRKINRLRELPLLTAMRRLGIAYWYMPILMLFVRRRMTPRMTEVAPCEGVVPMLRALQDAGHRMYILTSNYKENVQIFLKHHRMERFFGEVATVYYASTAVKTRALKKMLRRNMMKSSETYYVGNEALDVEAADRAGIKGIATTWGGFNQEELRKAKPFAIIDKPMDLVSLLQ